LISDRSRIAASRSLSYRGHSGFSRLRPLGGLPGSQSWAGDASEERVERTISVRVELAERETKPAASPYPKIDGLEIRKAHVALSGRIQFDPAVPEQREFLVGLKLGRAASATITFAVEAWTGSSRRAARARKTERT
jgi:hypothetical protein